MNSLEYTKHVIRTFKRVSDGAHGNTRGFHGSLTAFSLQKVLDAVDVYGRNFMDIGFGTGVVLAAALTSGASKAHGFELPENQANQHIFHAAMRRISNELVTIPNFSRRALVEFKDIVQVWLGNASLCTNCLYTVITLFLKWQVNSLPEGTEVIFTFWNGMELQTQIHILELCSSSKSLDSLVVFRDQDWRRPADILEQLEEFGDSSWSLHRTIKTSMHGSGERKTAWVFFCD